MIDSIEGAASAPAEARSATSSDKNQINENRRLNLCMLPTERGNKNRPAQLASTSGSRSNASQA